MSLEADIRAQLTAARDVIAGLSPDQINWRPAEGSWSMGECIAHLNTVNGLYADAIQRGISEAERGLRTLSAPKLSLLERWFVQALEPPYRLKFKAPAKFRPASTSFDEHNLLAEWKVTHERLADLARAARDVDIKRVRVVSPATP